MKPSSPSLSLKRHTRAITSVQVANANSLISASADSSVMIWDIRNTQEPVRTIVPDTKSVLALKLHPNKTSMAVSTLQVSQNYKSIGDYYRYITMYILN
jgi:WD40 repeat protein